MFKAALNSKKAWTFVPAIAGFFGYGAWGFFCNIMYGLQLGLQSGLVQGSLSFGITLASNVVMEFLFKTTGYKWLTIVVSASLFVGVSYLVNTLVGTPEVLLTIAPGAIFGTFYVVTYVSALNRMSNNWDQQT